LASDEEKLSNNIEQRSAQSSRLKKEASALLKALSDLANAQAEMNKRRITEKDAFTNSKADMEMGIEGVKQALKILREYYEKMSKHIRRQKVDHPASSASWRWLNLIFLRVWPR
jgi:Fic family protein